MMTPGVFHNMQHKIRNDYQFRQLTSLQTSTINLPNPPDAFDFRLKVSFFSKAKTTSAPFGSFSDSRWPRLEQKAKALAEKAAKATEATAPGKTSSGCFGIEHHGNY